MIELDLPGVGSEDIGVEINDREPAISGEIKERERKGVMRHRTRRPDVSSSGWCRPVTCRPRT